MSDLLGITVEDLVATARARNARIPSEIGAFVALEVCEALQDGPASVRPRDVRVADDGTISVFAPPHSATSEAAARSVSRLLGGLLVASGTHVPRALVSLMEHGPSSGRWELGSLRDDLEASLVPLNRAAARRVLSRMLRDVRRPRSAPASAQPPPSDDALDAQLDALLDGDALPAGVAPISDAPAAPSSADALDAELDATLSDLDADVAPPEPPVDPDDATLADADPAPAPPRIETPAPVAPAGHAPPRRIDPPAPLEPEPAYAPRRRTRSDAPTEPPPPLDDSLAGQLGEPAKRGGALGWIVAFVVLTAVTAAGLALLRPDLVDRALGRPPAPAPDPGPSEADREAALRAHRGRFGTLTVSGAPARAQVLMFVGRGPALATDLPVGVAHEFVAIADGRAPTRAVVPPDASWGEVEGRPRYELAMQTGAAPMTELALGPTQLPPDVGAPSGGLGDVRVITNPPGAKVYVLVGFAPDVTVQNVRTDGAVELLVYAEGAPVERVIVGPSDWVEAEGGGKRAEVTVSLAE